MACTRVYSASSCQKGIVLESRLQRERMMCQGVSDRTARPASAVRLPKDFFSRRKNKRSVITPRKAGTIRMDQIREPKSFVVRTLR